MKRTNIVSLTLLALLLPQAAFAEGGGSKPQVPAPQQGPGDMPLGDPEEQEVRQVTGEVSRDFGSQQLVIRESRSASYVLPPQAEVLVGRTVTVKAMMGEELSRGVFTLQQPIVWIAPQPESRQGTLVGKDGRAVLVSGDEEVALAPPSGLSHNALLFLRDRADVHLSGFLFSSQEGDELLVSGISGRIKSDLADNDRAYLSQRIAIPGEEPTEDGMRYEFNNDLDEDGRRRVLDAGAPVTVLDLELYRKAGEGESVGRWRDLPANFSMSDLAEDERLFVYVARQDRNRSPGDPSVEGWVPVRKVEIGRPLPAITPIIVDAPVPVDDTTLGPLDSSEPMEPTTQTGPGLDDVLSQQLDHEEEGEDEVEEPAETGQADEQESEQAAESYDSDAVFEGDPAEVATDQLLLRSAPDMKRSTRVLVMLEGQPLELTGERQGAYLGVRMLQPIDGWVAARLLDREGKVVPTHLNLRSEPRQVKGNETLILLQGFQLEVTDERQRGWVRVRTAEPIQGYAAEAYLQR